jgi:hypothetical protein
MYKKTIIILVITTLVLGRVHPMLTFAEDYPVGDGFQSSEEVESRFFTINIENGVDQENLVIALSVPESIKGIITEPTSAYNPYTIQGEMDLLYLAVVELMDIKMGKFKSNIKICKDKRSLAIVATNVYGRPGRTPAFYVFQADTLYIDADSINIHILAHELSHAVQSNYFVVPPSEKIQEVLAGYIEYQFRKNTNTLPKKRKKTR